jgi:hypothetical protein
MPRLWISVAVELTRWLHDRGLALEDLDQPLLDQWLAEGPPTRRQVRRFIAWLGREQRERRGLRVPGQPSGTPSSVTCASRRRPKPHPGPRRPPRRRVDGDLRARDRPGDRSPAGRIAFRTELGA